MLLSEVSKTIDIKKKVLIFLLFLMDCKLALYFFLKKSIRKTSSSFTKFVIQSNK